MRSLTQRACAASLAALVLSWDLALVPRRVALGSLGGVGCGCWGCWSKARAEVELKEELPLSRGRQDADFAKGMAFGIWDFSGAPKCSKGGWFPPTRIGISYVEFLSINLVADCFGVYIFVACCWSPILQKGFLLFRTVSVLRHDRL